MKSANSGPEKGPYGKQGSLAKAGFAAGLPTMFSGTPDSSRNRASSAPNVEAQRAEARLDNLEAEAPCQDHRQSRLPPSWD